MPSVPHGTRDESVQNAAETVAIHPDSLARSCVALVMAGGRGSRLAPLTDNDCKPAVPFGASNRIIDYTLSNCLNSGIHRIGVVTQFRQHSLLTHLQRGWSFMSAGAFGSSLELLPAQQDERNDWYQGTADAIHRNLAFIQRHAPRHVIVLAGDHVYRADYTEMLLEHELSGADVTVSCLTVPRAAARRYGIAEVDENNRIKGFVEKPQNDAAIPGNGTEVLASMGIYIFNTECLLDALSHDAKEASSQHDFGHDVLPRLIREHHVVAYPFINNRYGNYWRDVGTLDAYYGAHMDLLTAGESNRLHDPAWPIHGGQSHPSPTRMVTTPVSVNLGDVLLGGGCSLYGATIERTVVSTGCRVGDRARVYDSVLLPESSVGADCLLQRVILQQGVSLPAGSVIGRDLAQDFRRFPASESGVVVVTRESLCAIESAGELAALCPPREYGRGANGSAQPSRLAA